ncbi:hypothetical protein A3753_31135 [Sulfitobacter sp. HI0082]|nr:hypothetical protein A3753_31135 [Sulfitobacter sp. HI0082]
MTAMQNDHIMVEAHAITPGSADRGPFGVGQIPLCLRYGNRHVIKMPLQSRAQLPNCTEKLLSSL